MGFTPTVWIKTCRGVVGVFTALAFFSCVQLASVYNNIKEKTALTWLLHLKMFIVKSSSHFSTTVKWTAPSPGADADV